MKKLFLLLAVLCVFTGWCSAGAELSDAALLSDYDEALHILEENNPFLPIYRQYIPDFDSMCAETRGLVAERCHSARSLYQFMSDLFARLGNPGHLSMIGPEGYQLYMQLAEQGIYGKESAEYRLLHDPRTQAVYSEMIQESGKPETEDVSSLFLPFITWDPDRKILCIRIQSFKSTLIERDRNILADAVRTYPEVKHIVFDICGNGGGSDYYWMENLVAPFGEKVSFEKRVYFRDTELTREYGWMNDAVPLAEADIVKIPDFAEEMGLTYTQAGIIEIEPVEESRVIHTDAERWVLTDEYVYSAADGFAGFCKQSGWATLVGRRTRGDGGASAPVLVRLPESGLLMRFTLAASANEDGTLNTLSGTSPDLPSKPFEPPFKTVLRFIDRQTGR